METTSVCKIFETIQGERRLRPEETAHVQEAMVAAGQIVVDIKSG